MYASILQMITKPWLCSLQGITYVDDPLETGSTNPAKRKNAYTFIIVVKGKGVLEYSNGKTSVEPGSICLVRADVSFSVTADGGEGEALKFYTMSMADRASMASDRMVMGSRPTPDRLEQQMNESKLKLEDAVSVLEFTYTPWSECLECMEHLYRQRDVTDLYETWDVQMRFQQWFQSIIRQNDPELQLHNDRTRLRQSIHYIDVHYDQVSTVDELALRAGLSRTSYTRHFKRLTGQLPLDYVNTVRLERSKQLLQLTDDRLHDIASHVGFSNEYYFSRRFKQYAGITPGVYRRHHRQEVRVFAPYLEDFLLALGVKPVLQGSHHAWGRQHYLQLDDVPEFDVSQHDAEFQTDRVPEFIMLDMGYKTWNLDRFEQVAPVYYVKQNGEDWRAILKSAADVLGRTNRVKEVIDMYEDKAGEARRNLHGRVRQQTVAFLRISASGITLYGDQCGYVGPVIYRDLGLNPHHYVQKWTHRERRVSIGLEQLSQLDADHLLITFDTRESLTAGAERQLLDRKEWKQLSAVKYGCVYEVDFMTWMNYGVISHGKKIDDILRFIG
ncbi:helix-turn-helix domain-containing protein [Paenibacillus sp. FSL R7-0652]|uniref:Helix-turn-helix domain-containing protein n=1 Tax=Paenibacillus sp. AN1007 TaxID=3151385 RepID=A0AAU8NIA7_9BACL